MRIAVVGSGISGLVAARLLHARHDVTVFEADRRIGGHTHTVDVELEGEHHAVDTGFIIYNETTYPNFTRLLRALDVATQPTDMSFSAACERTGLEWASGGLGKVFAQPRNLLRPSFHRMLREVMRFHRESRRLLEGGDEKVALGDYLLGAGYSRGFLDGYVVPMGAAIWSADPDEFLRIPAATFVRFFDNHGLMSTKPTVPWRVIRGGSARYLEALVAPFRHRIVTGSPVHAVRRRPGLVEVATSDARQLFDHVVLAVHSDQALRMRVDASPLERFVLSAVRYQPNDVTLHSDLSLMPRRRRAWASWNYRMPCQPRGRAVVTYDMNRLQGLGARQPLLVTLNGDDRIDARLVHRRLVCHHPLLDAEAIAAQKRHAEVSGVDRVHYCGAWWGHGFHEDGVKSALAVCRTLGVDV